MRKITPTEAANLILSTYGTNPPCTFGVSFYRKNDKWGKCEECKGTGMDPKSRIGDLCDKCEGKKKVLVARKNDVRKMVAFLGANVQKGLKGGPRAYDPDEHGLVWSYEVPPGVSLEERPDRRRSIGVSGLVRLKIYEEEYEVEGQPW